jgi:hypothetical protein
MKIAQTTEEVAARGRATATATGYEDDAEQRDAVAEPDHRPGIAVAEACGRDGDKNRDGAHDDRRVTDAGVSDARVLQEDRDAVAEHAGAGNPPVERAAQVLAPDHSQDRRRHEEAHRCQPARVQPGERELGQRDRRPPEEAGSNQREYGGPVRHTFNNGASACVLCRLFDNSAYLRSDVSLYGSFT